MPRVVLSVSFMGNIYASSLVLVMQWIRVQPLLLFLPICACDCDELILCSRGIWMRDTDLACFPKRGVKNNRLRRLLSNLQSPLTPHPVQWPTEFQVILNSFQHHQFLFFQHVQVHIHPFLNLFSSLFNNVDSRALVVVVLCVAFHFPLFFCHY